MPLCKGASPAAHYSSRPPSASRARLSSLLLGVHCCLSPQSPTSLPRALPQPPPRRSVKPVSHSPRRPPEAGIQPDPECGPLVLWPSAPSRPLIQHENQVLHRGRGRAVPAWAAAELRWQRCPDARRRAAARCRRRAGVQAAWWPVPTSRAAAAATAAPAAAPAAITAASGRTTRAPDAAQGLPVVQGIPARSLEGPSRGPVPHQCHQVGDCGTARGEGGGRGGAAARVEVSAAPGSRSTHPAARKAACGRALRIRELGCWSLAGEQYCAVTQVHSVPKLKIDVSRKPFPYEGLQ